MQTNEIRSGNAGRWAADSEMAAPNDNFFLFFAPGEWISENGAIILISCIGISLIIHTLKGGTFTVGPNGLNLIPPALSH